MCYIYLCVLLYTHKYIYKFLKLKIINIDLTLLHIIKCSNKYKY